MIREQKNSFHRICPYGNDECPKCLLKRAKEMNDVTKKRIVVVLRAIGVKERIPAIIEIIKQENKIVKDKRVGVTDFEKFMILTTVLMMIGVSLITYIAIH